MAEYNILEKAGLPQTKERSVIRQPTDELRNIAERLNHMFYDADRKYGFGGYYYDGRWQKVAEVIMQRYNLNRDSKVLIDRCHKGFLVFDLMMAGKGITVYGMHPKEYALNHAMDGYGRWELSNSSPNKDSQAIESEARDLIMPYLIKGDGYEIPFKDGFFDSVISIENACSYPEEQCRRNVREIIRVSKNGGKNCYIQNDSWNNAHEEKCLRNWTLLCKTFLDVKGWEKLFAEENYNGDWGFTIIK